MSHATDCRTQKQMIVDKRLMFVTVIFKIECVQYLRLTMRHYSKE